MNTLKSFVRNIAERTEDRKVSSPTDGENVEGFLCPKCMNSFDSAEALQFHFNNDHNNNDTPNNISVDFADVEDDSFDSRDKQSIYSEGSSQFPKTPSESDQLNRSVSDFSISQSKLHSSKDECSGCIDLTQEHALQVKALETKVDSLNQDLSCKYKEIEDQKNQFSQELSFLKEIIQSKSDEITVLKGSVDDLKCDKNEFVQNESVKLSELSKKLENSQNLHKSQLKALNELKKKYEEEKLEKDQLSCTHFEKEKKIFSLEKLISELKSQITQFEQDRTKLLKEIELGEGTNMALDQLKQENEQLSKQIKMEKNASQKLGEDLQSQISKLNQELIETKSKCLSLSDSLEQFKEKVCSITSKCDTLSAAKEQISLQLDSKTKLIDDQNKKYKELECKLNQASEKNLEMGIEKSNLTGKLEKLTSKIKDLEKCKESIDEKLNEKSSQVEDLAAQVQTLLNEKSCLEGYIAEKNEEIHILRTEAKKFLDEKQSLTLSYEISIKDLNDENSKLKLDKDDIFSEKNQLEKNICSLQKSYEVKVEDLNIKLKEANISIDTYASIKTELMEKLNKLEVERNALKEKIDNLTQSFEDQTGKLRESISNLEKEKNEKVHFYEEKIYELDDRLKKSMTNLNELQEKSKKFQELRTNLDKKLNESITSRDYLLSQKLELEAQVGASNDERKGLLERCLGAETELDRSRSNCIELRRKLDDSQAALHELGRENQSIQLELNKLTGRKWADDSEVTECVGCKSQFSITIRKHHCRNCGQIFCKDCSSKTSSNMKNYKKPQRVCDGCYEELAVK